MRSTLFVLSLITILATAAAVLVAYVFDPNKIAILASLLQSVSAVVAFLWIAAGMRIQHRQIELQSESLRHQETELEILRTTTRQTAAASKLEVALALHEPALKELDQCALELLGIIDISIENNNISDKDQDAHIQIILSLPNLNDLLAAAIDRHQQSVSYAVKIYIQRAKAAEELFSSVGDHTAILAYLYYNTPVHALRLKLENATARLGL